jgi:hypothetical protein
LARAKGRDEREPSSRYPEGWVVSHEMTANGRRIVGGTELSFSGQSGRFRFVKHVVNGDLEWVDVVDGKDGARWRSFSPASIKRVHYKNKTRANRQDQ